MWRTTLGSLVGMLTGIGLTSLILRVTYSVIHLLTTPREYEIDPASIYLTLVLGAGFGALCGALAGLAGVVTHEWRRGKSVRAD